jgi:hypothetical protein
MDLSRAVRLPSGNGPHLSAGRSRDGTDTNKHEASRSGLDRLQCSAVPARCTTAASRRARLSSQIDDVPATHEGLGGPASDYLPAVASCEEMLLKVLFSCDPSVLTTVMMATEMPAAIRPYSIAVAPDSSFAKCLKVLVMACSCSKLWLLEPVPRRRYPSSGQLNLPLICLIAVVAALITLQKFG